MDPNETLRRIRSLVLQIEKDKSGMAHGAEELAELVHALDHWISSGGFFPAAWTSQFVPGARMVCSNGMRDTSEEADLDEADAAYAKAFGDEG